MKYLYEDSYIKPIKSWLENPIKEGLYIIGPSGSGKTSIIKNYLENNYNLSYISSINLPIKNDTEEFIENHLQSKSILDIFDIEVSKKILWIDNVEVISRIHKLFLDSILKYINKSDYPYILFTGNKYPITYHNMLIKHLQFIEIKSLNKTVLTKFSKKYIKDKNIKVDQKRIKEIIDKIDGDIRQLIIQLEKTEDVVKNGMIDKDISLVKISDSILKNHCDYENCQRFLELDYSLVPMMIHENYIQLFNKKIQPKYLNNIVDVSSKIMNSLILNDMMDTKQQNDNTAELYDIMSVISCKNINHEVMNNLELKTPIKEIKFTRYLNKGSYQSIIKMSLVNIMLKFRLDTPDEVWYFRQYILYILFEKNDKSILNKLIEHLDKNLLQMDNNIDIILSLIRLRPIILPGYSKNCTIQQLKQIIKKILTNN